jgi:hypothetical protein
VYTLYINRKNNGIRMNSTDASEIHSSRKRADGCRKSGINREINDNAICEGIIKNKTNRISCGRIIIKSQQTN